MERLGRVLAVSILVPAAVAAAILFWSPSILASAPADTALVDTVPVEAMPVEDVQPEASSPAERPEESEFWVPPAWLFEWQPGDALSIEQQVTLSFRVNELLDEVAGRIGIDWRSQVERVAVDCWGEDCPYGVAVRSWGGDDSLVFAPDLFLLMPYDQELVVAHELAHVWQYETGVDGLPFLPGGQTEEAVAEQGVEDVSLSELAADCLAAAWGFAPEGAWYWHCPTDVADAMLAEYLAVPLSAGR